MAKDKNKVAPADGALVKQGSAKRRNRKAWPGDEEQDKSPKSGKRCDLGVPSCGGAFTSFKRVVSRNDGILRPFGPFPVNTTPRAGGRK